MISQMLERQQWYFETPLRQFKAIPGDLIAKIEHKDIQIDEFREMDYKEIGNYEI